MDPQAYWNTRLERSEGLAGVGYARLGHAFNKWMYRIRSEVFHSVVKAHICIRPTTSVLDIGSGTGHYVNEWLQLGVQNVTASDITPIASQRLRAAFPSCTVTTFDVSEWAPSEHIERYDIISAFDVLFHITDDHAYAHALVNCAQALKPGGYFVFSENFVRHDGLRTGHMANRPYWMIESALHSAGFEIIARRPMFVLMNYPVNLPGRYPHYLWTALVAPAMLSERAGYLLGACLALLERRLLRRVRKSPSTEIVVCRKATLPAARVGSFANVSRPSERWGSNMGPVSLSHRPLATQPLSGQVPANER